MENYPYPPETDPEQAQQLQDPLMNSGSAGDCTGLIPSMPEDGEELDSYAELYGFLPPEPGKSAEIKTPLSRCRGESCNIYQSVETKRLNASLPLSVRLNTPASSRTWPNTFPTSA